jgi:hypothetical protein
MQMDTATILYLEMCFSHCCFIYVFVSTASSICVVEATFQLQRCPTLNTKESGSSLIDHVAYDFATGTLRILGCPSFDKWETKRTLILTGAERSIGFNSSTKSASLIHPYV